VGVRTGDGKLSAVRFGSDSFAIRDWLAADADARTATDKAIKDGFACDAQGCVGRTKDGAIVAVARTAQAVAEDCARAALVVTPREAPPNCSAAVLDRKALAASGATAGYRADGAWRLEWTYPAGYSRPWARRDAGETPATAATRPASRDA